MVKMGIELWIRTCIIALIMYGTAWGQTLREGKNEALWGSFIHITGKRHLTDADCLSLNHLQDTYRSRASLALCNLIDSLKRTYTRINLRILQKEDPRPECPMGGETEFCTGRLLVRYDCSIPGEIIYSVPQTILFELCNMDNKFAFEAIDHWFFQKSLQRFGNAALLQKIEDDLFAKISVSGLHVKQAPFGELFLKEYENFQEEIYKIIDDTDLKQFEELGAIYTHYIPPRVHALVDEIVEISSFRRYLDMVHLVPFRSFEPEPFPIDTSIPLTAFYLGDYIDPNHYESYARVLSKQAAWPPISHCWAEIIRNLYDRLQKALYGRHSCFLEKRRAIGRLELYLKEAIGELKEHPSVWSVFRRELKMIDDLCSLTGH